MLVPTGTMIMIFDIHIQDLLSCLWTLQLGHRSHGDGRNCSRRGFGEGVSHRLLQVSGCLQKHERSRSVDQ